MLPLAQENRLDLTLDVAESLPDQLRGDPRLLREILVNLAVGCLPMAERGKMQLSVYGKALDGRVHLLFSARVFSDSDTTREASGLSMEIVSTLLTGMGSALKSVRSPAGRGERYFEIEQQVLDPAPIGKLSVEDV